LIVNALSRLLIWSMKPHRVMARQRRRADVATEAAPA
jgi:hypothetical protein